MKKVLFVYDDISHQRKLQNLVSFDQSNLYEYEDIYVRDTEDIFKLFMSTNPDIIIIDVLFDDEKFFNIVNRIFDNKKDRYLNFKVN